MLRFTIRSFSSLSMCRVPSKPLVVIIGATGTGKSDLAVELACKFNGEIVNGDAMQLYEGLPIITNKITQDEMRGVPHHLLGCIGLEEETWSVGKFVGKAIGVIDEVRSRGRLPILVGGTHYYTQSLLFQDALADDVLLEGDGKKEQFPILDEPTEIILEKLREVDPVMAERWHPNERRKIQRSLEIYLRTGKPASQIYDAQRRRREGETVANDPNSTANTDGTGLRFPTLMLWVHAQKDVLYPRLEERIIKMLDKGLLEEVETLNKFRVSYEDRTGSTIDQSRGIWVSIGYKEFLTYQSARSDAQYSEADVEEHKQAGIEKAQAATRQYANRQLKWIRIKLLNALFGASQKGNTFLLDGSDISKWEEQVLQPARHITAQFLSGQTLPEPTELSFLASEMLKPKRDYDLGQRPDLWQKKVCETCGTVVVTENDWKLHVNSRAHRRAVGTKKKQAGLLHNHSREMKTVQADLVDVLEAYQHTFDENTLG